MVLYTGARAPSPRRELALSRAWHADSIQAVRLRSQGECSVVCGHDQADARRFLPEQGCSQVDGIERTELRWHGLSRAIKNSLVDLDDLQ